MDEVVVDLTVFEAFPRWSGRVPAGYWASWLGVLTPVYVRNFNNPGNVNEERFESPGYPRCDAAVFDHLALAEAVLNADEEFIAIDLGAGWGRWLANAAYAARATGRSYRLVGVEAEPMHFAWMVQHLQEAGIPSDRCRLIEAAVSNTSGECWFYVGKPGSWYGQSVVPDGQLASTSDSPFPLGVEISHNRETIRRIRKVSFEDVLGELQRVDYLQLDVQGAELDVLSANPRLLDERIKHINIGTHSQDVEAGLRAIFERLGWVSQYDIPLKSRLLLRTKNGEAREAQFGDGVQIWHNPRFARTAKKQLEPCLASCPA